MPNENLPLSGEPPVLTAADRTAMEVAARDQGFARLGVAAVPPLGSDEDLLQRRRFQEWVEQGRAGEMAWLTRRDAEGELLRSSLHRAVPWARSVVLCASVYNTAEPRSVDPAPADSGWIARYAWSGAVTETSNALKPTDYHDVLLARLRQVEAVLQERQGAAIQTRCYVDTGPVVERHLAQLAGVGWIGKNTCVLNQEFGSWMLLGVILTSLPLAPEASLAPAADRCGSCTRCIDACPTDALVAPRQMDASRCIAYLTIEKKGSIAEELREPMGRQVFGCDICQDVCPWNRRAPVSADPQMQARSELVNPPLEWLAGLDGPAFNRTFRGSPLERTGRKRLHRNVAIAMGNSRNAVHKDRLTGWLQAEDPVLAEAAEWALRQIERGGLPRAGGPAGNSETALLASWESEGIVEPE